LFPRTAVLAFLLLGGCNSKLLRKPTFQGPDEVERHLAAHENEFARVAEDWSKEQPTDLMFCYFGDGDYRWNKTFIRAGANGFNIRNTDETGLTLAESARRAGTSEGVLNSWIQRAKALKIYSIERDGGSGDVTIRLEGSEWKPYGLRYVKSGNRSLRHLRGPWFYTDKRD
jgi:hypothetical protein